MLVKADDVLLKEGDGQSRRTRRRLALSVLMTLISIAVPGFRFYNAAGVAHNATVLNLGPTPLRAHFSCARVTSLVSPDPSGSMAAWATNERPVRSEVRRCDAAGVELPPYSVSVVSL